MKKEKSLRQSIAREEANLTTLEQKQQQSRERLATLRADLAAITSAISNPSASATQPSADIPTTPKEKVSLFRNLFHVVALVTSLPCHCNMNHDKQVTPSSVNRCAISF
ncbi:MAG: hypothetical protein QNL90_11110 [Gammaproteobacteria bacterium]|nr:hypothetical protein [Gammaproteobacteria bacterium]